MGDEDDKDRDKKPEPHPLEEIPKAFRHLEEALDEVGEATQRKKEESPD